MQDYWNNPPESPEPPEWLEMLDDMLSSIPMPDSIAEAMRKAMDDWIDECNKEQADPSWARSPIHHEVSEWEKESIHSQHVNKPD